MIQHTGTASQIAQYNDKGVWGFLIDNSEGQIEFVVWPHHSITQPILEKTYVIAGGYTAGHLTPGLAVAEEFRERLPDIQILVAGWTDPAEEAFVRNSGVSFLALPASPWASQSLATRGRSIARMIPAIRIARKRFRQSGAVGLLSLGSFAAFAPTLAARSLGLPVTVFEPNAQFGLANRLLVSFADQVLVSKLFDLGQKPGRLPTEVTGVPLRSSIQSLSAPQSRMPDGTAHILVEGGSLGNPFFNEKVPLLAAHLLQTGIKFRVTHQCGRNTDPGPIVSAYQNAGIEAQVEPFFDAISPVLASANIVLTSAGAISLHEIASAGIPLVVTPLREGAAAHQYANAEVFGKATGCAIRPEESWDAGEIAQHIAAALNTPTEWSSQSAALRDFASDEARSRVVNQLVAAVPNLCP